MSAFDREKFYKRLGINIDDQSPAKKEKDKGPEEQDKNQDDKKDSSLQDQNTIELTRLTILEAHPADEDSKINDKTMISKVDSHNSPRVIESQDIGI